jgi:hypothetical protein
MKLSGKNGFFTLQKLLINYVNSEYLSLWIQAIEFECGLFKGDSHVNDTEKRKQQKFCDLSESDDHKAVLDIKVAGSAYLASSPNQRN